MSPPDVCILYPVVMRVPPMEKTDMVMGRSLNGAWMESMVLNRKSSDRATNNKSNEYLELIQVFVKELQNKYI